MNWDYNSLCENAEAVEQAISYLEEIETDVKRLGLQAELDTKIDFTTEKEALSVLLHKLDALIIEDNERERAEFERDSRREMFLL